MSESEEMNTRGGDAGMTAGGDEKIDAGNQPAVQEGNETEIIEMQGELVGHNGWVTCIVTSLENPDMLLTGSRDNSVLVWQLERKVEDRSRGQVRIVEGKMVRRLTGHSSFVQDIDISIDRKFALSASWDGSLRLWNIETGETTKRFQGHSRDVLSVAFSSNNRKIVSGSRDHTVKVWNTIGETKETLTGEDGHSNWVTCCRFSPNVEEPVIVTASRDRVVKVWDANSYTLKHNLIGHQDYVNSVTVSPDGSLCASGGKDGVAMLWDLNEGKKLSSLDAGGEIHALSFSPNRYWLCGAVGEAIKIWDLETKVLVGTLKTAKKKKEKQEEQQPQRNRRGAKKKKKKRLRAPLPVLCTCMAWSHDGKTLFAGYSDSIIRVWSLI